MEGSDPGDHLVKDQAKGINVTGCSQRLSQDLLRRHIRRGSEHHAPGDCAGGISSRWHAAGNAKISYYGPHLLARPDEHHVAAFKITVQNTRQVRSSQGLA